LPATDITTPNWWACPSPATLSALALAVSW